MVLGSVLLLIIMLGALGLYFLSVDEEDRVFVGIVLFVLLVNLLLYPFGKGVFAPPVPVPTPELAGYEVVVEHQKALSELRWHVAAQREEILQGIDNQLALGDTAGAAHVIQRLRVLNDPEILQLEKAVRQREQEEQRVHQLWLAYGAEEAQTDALIRDSLAKMKEGERKRGVWQEKMAAQIAKRDAALRILVSQKDRVGGIVWYQDRSTPPGREQEPIFLVIRDGRHARDESQEGLHLGLQVHRRQKVPPRKGASRDVKVSVLADGEDLRFYLRAREDLDGLWWSDNALDDYDGLERLDRLLQARKVVLRFEDGPRVVEVPVSPRAKTAMRHVRDAYRAMAALEWLEILGP